ncbi:MAG: TolC family outer membrane protein, partial [Gammaproteobacteria bacterium]|nr:TolC family outer membrane protein [Gammaproteobacteria bacterium]
FDVGLIAITDVKESQAKYDVSVAQQIDAKNKLAISFESLRSLVGEMPVSLKPLSVDMALIIPQPANMEKWVDSGKKNNLSLQAARLSYDVARKQIDIDKADHYPSLGLSVNHDYSSPDGGRFSSDSKDTTVSLKLTIPIYSGGLTSAKTRQAVLLAEQARALRDKAYRQAVQQIRESYLGVTTSIAQVKAFKQSLISTQAAHEATQAGFEVGTRIAVDVLASLREQFRAERDYAKARYTYVLNLLKLKSAAGILSRQDVVQVNRWLKL